METYRNALVTGGGKGIGRAVARALARAGFGVVIAYNTSERAAMALCDELNGTSRATAVQADLTHTDGVAAVRAACTAFGGIDTLVNNAGVSLEGLLQDVTDEQYDRVMDANVKAPFRLIRAFLPDMLSSHFGRIVNIASIWGQVGGATETVYSASKAALIGLTKALAKETALSGVTVNAVAPGAIDTDMTAGLSAADRAAVAAEIPMGRFGTPEEVAEIVELLTRRTSYMTGQVIGVNGGWAV